MRYRPSIEHILLFLAIAVTAFALLLSLSTPTEPVQPSGSTNYGIISLPGVTNHFRLPDVPDFTNHVLASESNSTPDIAYLFDTSTVTYRTNILWQVRTNGEPVVTIYDDGKVSYNTNDVDEATRVFWQVLSEHLKWQRPLP